MAKKLFEIQTDKIVNGTKLMYKNTALTSWTGDLSRMTNGHGMFSYCSNLTSFTGELSSLTDGNYMFDWCRNLATFTGDLSSLTEAYGMFANCYNLESFSSDLSNLMDGEMMFFGCETLTSFNSDLSSLTNGYHMFEDCNNLSTFNADLSSLTNGQSMFGGCNLDAESVKKIALTINKTVTNNPKLNLGIFGAIIVDEQVKKDVGLIKYKGWDVYTNNSNATSTYILPKYAGCTGVDSIKAKDTNYKTNDIVNGVWSEHLPDVVHSTNPEGDGIFNGCTTTLTTFNADLSSLYVGNNMFYQCTNLTTFNSNLSSLVAGISMFSTCPNLTSFNSDLSKLTNGNYMFYGCENLTSFNSNLSSLTNGANMFYYCNALTTFISDLSSLTDGNWMFHDCENLTTFNANLSSLTDGDYMFSDCRSLTSFNNDLSNLTNGDSMFYNCDNLTSFRGNLSKLTDGYYMFQGCKLDTASVQHIADTINTHNGTIYIGIGNTTPNTEEATAFNTIASRGWTVYVTVNGGSESYWNPTSLDGEETTTPIPFYAKPVQSDEQHARYTDEQGNYYNILGGQFIYGDDLSTYGMFINEEDAAANMRLTKIEE